MPSPVRALSPGDSLSSYDYFSSHSRSTSQDASSGDSDSYGTVSDDVSSEDEIVLSFSDISSLEVVSQRGDVPATPGVFSDDEFVIMSRPRTPREDDLAASFSALALSTTSARSSRRPAAGSDKSSPSSTKSAKRRAKKKRSAARALDNGVAASNPSSTKAVVSSSKATGNPQDTTKSRRKAKRAAARAAAASATSGFGDRPIVDDVSEAGTEYPALSVPPAVYKNAQSYVSSYVLAENHLPTKTLTNVLPRSVLSADQSAKSGMSKLAFLQALIIELGLYPASQTAVVTTSSSFFSLPSLPSSLRAAKALLKSQVFLNVRDYLAVRSQGIEALRRVMHPSRSALMRELRSGKKVSVKTVKESGLSVLLVTCYR
ncbi:hypothetical protein ONZ51_g6572 [Trametes cubensis]|uniref:Uncharacterized protein n=1 Tax=Trametes cubensis TaxID=1111947 RepID=A0AAD7TS54_9APHY|nr:hypothetical protein ONZ51_g6572 [Trametes cubensis]